MTESAAGKTDTAEVQNNAGGIEHAMRSLHITCPDFGCRFLAVAMMKSCRPQRAHALNQGDSDRDG